MSEAERIRSVSFRPTDEEDGEIEKAAVAAATSRTTGAGSLPLPPPGRPALWQNRRLVYTDLAILRFLVGHGFKLLFSRNAAGAAVWTKVRTQADQRSDEIVQELLSRRK